MTKIVQTLSVYLDTAHTGDPFHRRIIQPDHSPHRGDAPLRRATPKKLTDAVSHWLRGETGSQERALDDDLSAFGLSVSLEEAADEDGFSLWPDNAPTFELFLRCATQWRVAPMGGVIGLDYSAVEWVARVCGVQVDAERLDDLRQMEATALSVWREK